MYLASRFFVGKHTSIIRFCSILSSESLFRADMTIPEKEKEMFKVKRKMGLLYSQGKYKESLDSASLLEAQVREVFGVNNAVHASCLNNIGLMQKMLGSNEEAMENYVKALHSYEKSVGKDHKSYSSCLNNVGVLYKTMAANASGLDKANLLDRADEALSDSLKLRMKNLGEDSRDTLLSGIALSSVWALRMKYGEAESQYRDLLEKCIKLFGEKDILTATTQNNLAGLLKNIAVNNHKNKANDRHSGEFQPEQQKAEPASTLIPKCELINEAIELYDCAYATRSEVLGDSHPETITTLFNKVELLHCIGEDDLAVQLQQKIISDLGGEDKLVELIKDKDSNES